MKTERKRRIFIIRMIIALIVVILVFFLIRCTVSKGYFGKFGGPEICGSTQCFKIEIADTPKTREIGLMNRTSLENDRGMLFVFQQPGQYSFWMRNTLIPLDMIRLDQDFKILYIQNMAPSCAADPCPLYDPLISASYVLEINGGTASELGVKVGDSMKFKK